MGTFGAYSARKVQRWAALRHENVIQIYAPIASDLELVSTCYLQGDLRSYLQNSQITTREIIRLIENMINGLLYLHTQTPPIVHGNINAGKIFVDATGTAKIGEFGLAASTMAFPDLVPSISHAGLVRWMSPERFAPDEQAAKPTVNSDIWALGCTFLEILTRKLPYFQYKHDAKVTQRILQGELPDLQPQVDDRTATNNTIWNIMHQCWEKSPALRPDCRTLLEQLPDQASTLYLFLSYTPFISHYNEWRLYASNEF
ncbi:hypothetical protein FRC08_002666 [Ceratobasidium sp. 394]|nr:hypothetical protein FRC08_002666 [Ceratobasidium sp. 394]